MMKRIHNLAVLGAIADMVIEGSARPVPSTEGTGEQRGTQAFVPIFLDFPSMMLLGFERAWTFTESSREACSKWRLRMRAY